MQWYTQNPEIGRPVAVCLVLISAGILAELMTPGTATRSDPAALVYEAPIQIKGDLQAARATIPSETGSAPYFDLDDPAE